MSNEEKTNFILRKRHLPLRELAAQAGLTEGEVAEILKKAGEGKAAPPAPAPPDFPRTGKGVLAGCVAFLVLAVVLCYLPVLPNDFVNWDDPSTITENPAIRHLDGAFLKWMFTTSATTNWMPLTWLSFALDYRMGGLNPQIFHATNVLLHILNTILVLGVCLRLLKALPGREGAVSPPAVKAFALPVAFLTALLFGLHPIHVESVAWATERKDVLYSFFYLWSLYLYLDYANQNFNFEFSILNFKFWKFLKLRFKKNLLNPEPKTQNPHSFSMMNGASGPTMRTVSPSSPSSGEARYPTKKMRAKLIWCLLLFVLALLSKPMAVTLPFVFLILDYWPCRRLSRGWAPALWEKAPFFALALASAAVTFFTHEKTLPYARGGVEWYWLLNAFRSVVFYILKMAWPSGLAAYYPFPPSRTPGYLLEDFSAVGLTLAAFYFFFRLRRKAPYLWAAWLYYLVTLAPVLGLIQSGSQAAADRYTYLPSLAFLLLASAAAAKWVSYNPTLYGALSLSAATVLGFLTVGQIGTWRNTSALWERVTQVYPEENPDAYSGLGMSYIKAHRYDEALDAFSRAASIPPPLERTFEGLGTALAYKDQFPEAIKAFDYALTLDPQATGPRAELWRVYEKLGRHGEAIDQMKEAIRLEPGTALFQNNLGVSYGFLKRYPEAEAAFAKAHRLDPGNSEYLVNLATICQWEGKTQEALEWYWKGIAGDPREPLYDLKMGDLYLSQGKKQKALNCLQKAWELHPTNPKVARQIGEDFEALGKEDLALECFAQAQRLAATEKGLSPPAAGPQ